MIVDCLYDTGAGAGGFSQNMVNSGTGKDGGNGVRPAMWIVIQ